MERYKVRCEDCPNLKIKGSCWTCTECFGQKCAEIDDCPEGVTAEQIEAIAEATKGRVDTGAGTGHKKTITKPREKKENVTKKEIISAICSGLSAKNIEFVVRNDEKYVDFTLNDVEYTINLVAHRKKK